MLHQHFEAQAQRTPHAIALHDPNASITFDALNDRAARVAGLLAARGIRDGFVGLHVERSIDYVAAVLGILKARLAVIPLPPSYPESRLRAITEFADLDAVLDSDSTPLSPGLSPNVIRVSEARTAAPFDADASRSTGADQPAYVLSSSGSTGHPKLIVRSHRSFFHRLRWTWSEHPFAPDEVCVQKSHMTTTHAIYELFEPLLRGIAVHIIPDEQVRQLSKFWEAIATHEISRLLIVPSMLQASLDMPDFVPPSLRMLVLMGEHVPQPLVARMLESFPSTTKIVSIYGSTEASSALVCDVRADFRAGEELPLGKPISPDVGAQVLNDALEPVPAGDAGMLYISGSPLFSGYYKDPALTAAALANCDGTPLYRTQDRVRVSADGNLRFTGRVDDTVKIRGFRVDLQDVESAIAAHPGVRQCVVLARADERGATSLAAFVTPASVATRGVLDTIRQKLPPYMAPSSIVALDAFPLTASGKLDRQTLLAHRVDEHAEADGAFSSDTERRVAGVWTKVLGHARLDRESSFFEIGGSSLDVFRMVHELCAEFGLNSDALAELAVYQHPGLADLAAYIDALREGRAPTAPTSDAVLVTLKRAADPSLAPVFVISSAGGTLGAYEKLVKALTCRREVIGVRDPFLWNDRDPTRGFQAWVTRYVDSIQRRQPKGPYYIVAYSSAGAFGFEIACRLREQGEEVALLALVDPLALDRGSKRRFGYWAMDARFMRREVTTALRISAPFRRMMPRSLLRRSFESAPDWTLSRGEYERVVKRTQTDCDHIRRVSILLELNTGRPFSLSPAEVSGAGSAACLDLLRERVRRVSPEIDPEMLGNLVVQYELQVRSQHQYRLRPYDGSVSLFEPDGQFIGLEAAQIRPYVKKLRTWPLALGAAATGPSILDDAFPQRIRTHYLCMRDGVFVAQLARELDALLG